MPKKVIEIALSIRQPYAELILRGEKKWEYRSWSTKKKNERIYIHAPLKPAEDDKAWRKAAAQPGDLPVGVIVGSVEIERCEECDGGFRFKLANPKRCRPRRNTNTANARFFRPF